MPFIDLATPPTPPQRTDDPETFIARADAWVAWQEQFSADLAVFIPQLEAAAALIAAAPEYADPGLVAMTGKTPAADRFIYFTGSAASALATLTAFARTLLDDADAAAFLTTLGFSAFIQTLLNDADQGTALATLGAASAGANNDITALDQDVTITAAGNIAANTLGFRGLPDSGQTPGSGITLALADAGKMVVNTAGGWTIPANGSIAFPVGTSIVLFNNSGSDQALAITTDTLRWAGTTATGARTVLPYGLATVVKTLSTTWVVTGNVV